jgi:hypothetical protein
LDGPSAIPTTLRKEDFDSDPELLKKTLPGANAIGGNPSYSSAPVSATSHVAHLAKHDGSSFAHWADETEALKKETIQFAIEVAQRVEATSFELGHVLCVLEDNRWYKPFASPEEYAARILNIPRGTARFLMDRCRMLANCGLSLSAVSAIDPYKASLLADVVDPDNVGEWVKFAKSEDSCTFTNRVRCRLGENAAKAAKETGLRGRSAPQESQPARKKKQPASAPALQ